MNVNYLIFKSGLLFVVIFITGFFLGQEKTKKNIWTGFYYPNVDEIEDKRTWVVSPPLYSLNKCREWVNAVRHPKDNFDYSCGRGCRFTTEYKNENIICKTDSK